MKVHDGGFQLVSNHEYTGSSLGVHWYLGVDGISIFLVLLTALLFPLAIILGRNRENTRAYFAWILLLEAAVMGSFLSLDLHRLLLHVRADAGALVLHHRRVGAPAAGLRGHQVLPLHLPRLGLPPGRHPGPGLHPRVAVPLPDLLARAARCRPTCRRRRGSSCSWPSRRPSPSRRRCSRSTPGRPTPTPRPPRRARCCSRACWPSWAPTASSASTSACSPRPRARWRRCLLTLAVIGIVYGAIVACAQRDLKRLVAYSSLAQIGFIALGTFALSTQGLAGGVLLMLNHGLIVAALFILIGFIYQRRGTWQASELRGLQKAAPVLAGGLHRGHAGLHRGARAQRLRERVPGALGHLHHPPLVGRGRRARA